MTITNFKKEDVKEIITNRIKQDEDITETIKEIEDEDDFELALTDILDLLSELEQEQKGIVKIDDEHITDIAFSLSKEILKDLTK